MMNVRRKSKNDSEENSDEIAQPVNVNIHISCSLDPSNPGQGVQCKISHPNLIPEEDDMVKRIELARKQDLEELEEGEEEELESDFLKSKTKKSLKHDPKEVEVDQKDEAICEDSETYDSNPALDDTLELGEDDETDDPLLECITKSTMRRRK